MISKCLAPLDFFDCLTQPKSNRRTMIAFVLAYVLLLQLQCTLAFTHGSVSIDHFGQAKQLLNIGHSVIALTDSWLYCLNGTNGNVLWKTLHSLDDSDAILMSSHADMTSVYIVGASVQSVSVVSARVADGSMVWTKSAPLSLSVPAIEPHMLSLTWNSAKLSLDALIGDTLVRVDDREIKVFHLLQQSQLDHLRLLRNGLDIDSAFLIVCDVNYSHFQAVSLKGDQLSISEVENPLTPVSGFLAMRRDDAYFGPASKREIAIVFSSWTVNSQTLEITLGAIDNTKYSYQQVTESYQLPDGSNWQVLQVDFKHYTAKNSEIVVQLTAEGKYLMLKVMLVLHPTLLWSIEASTVAHKPLVSISHYLPHRPSFADENVVQSVDLDAAAVIGIQIADNLKIVAFDSKVVAINANGIVLWGRDDSLASAQHIFTVGEDPDAVFNTETPASFLVVRYSTTNADLKQCPQPFDDLHLAVALVSIGADSILAIREAHLVLPTSFRAAKVNSVRVVNGVSGSRLAFVVARTTSGTVVWSIRKFNSDLIELFHSSQQKYFSHEKIHPVVHLSSSDGALESVSAVSDQSEHLVGLSMLLRLPNETFSVVNFADELQQLPTDSQFLSRIDENSLVTYMSSSQNCMDTLDVVVNLMGHASCKIAAVTSRVQFDTQERITEVFSSAANDRAYSRSVVVGDDNVLVKYLNPNAIVVCTERSIMDDSTAVVHSALFVHIIDTVSGKILVRAQHDHASGPYHGTILENFILIAYWNPKAKRSELSVMSLYEGLIGKYDFTPFSSKRSSARNEYDLSVVTTDGRVAFHSAFDAAIPLSMSKLYALPGKVSGMSHSLSARGITNKNVVLGLTSGQVYSVDLRLVNPRRPLQDPTNAEKEEGLQRYSPLLNLSPLQSVTKTSSVPHSTLLLTASRGQLESQSIVFGIAPNKAVFVAEISASGGFDRLADDFNFSMLLASIIALAAVVFALRQWNNKSTLKRIWL